MHLWDVRPVTLQGNTITQNNAGQVLASNRAQKRVLQQSIWQYFQGPGKKAARREKPWVEKPWVDKGLGKGAKGAGSYHEGNGQWEKGGKDKGGKGAKGKSKDKGKGKSKSKQW